MASYQVDRGAWGRYTIFEQMGNIGSEVGRAIKAHRSGNDKRRQGAMDRAFDLFDATVECLADRQSPRLREVLLAREEFARLFSDGAFDEDADALERYFASFAIAARKGTSEDHDREEQRE
ncbi:MULTISPECIES: hypothetical protein [unclassified Adlercreutzia]|uniref:hypothetical protein n=1 Tax=unclassified Adlercreutzia TaxID=2636013 RepID=UPI0013EC427B|nr:MULTISPECIES: hypothetical protein [unclassified Adlercreutzia]